MPTEINFVKNQDRSFFNIHKPVPYVFDPELYQQNQRRNPLPEAEANRQEGSGRVRPGFQFGSGNKPMQNNFDPRVKAPVDRIYNGLPALSVHSRVHNPHLRIQSGYGKQKLQAGYGMKHHQHGGYSNPAVNNWLPGTKIKEPMRVYELSTASQVHSKPVDPIRNPPTSKSNRWLGHNSYEDWKPLQSTAPMYNHPLRQVKHNPLVVKY